MKKFVLRLELQDEDDKRRALKTVSSLAGIDEITIDLEGKSLTVVGTVDPVTVVSKLRKKNWPTNIISVGPANEPEKTEEQKKKEEELKKEEETKKDKEAKAELETIVGTAMAYRQYHPSMNTYYYVDHSIEENPNACVIC